MTQAEHPQTVEGRPLEDVYREALQRIIDIDPEWIGPSDELVAASRKCPECKERRLRDWPPSGLCDAHYRDFAAVERANEDRRRYFASVLRDIAREALAR